VLVDPGLGDLGALTWLGTYVLVAGALQGYRAAGLRSSTLGREPVAAWRWPAWVAQLVPLRLLASRALRGQWPLVRHRQK
jgi:hypothetical protein